MKVIAINGSPRKNGNTAILINKVFESLKEQGIETELLQLAGKKISGCIACYKCAEKKNRRCAINDDAVNVCIAKMDEADAIIFASPTYFCDLTPELKALIDRAGVVGRVNESMFKRKVGAAVVAVRRAGALHTFNSINHFFYIEQMIVAGSNYWNIGFGGKEIGDVNHDEEGLTTMRTLGENMGWLLKKLHA